MKYLTFLIFFLLLFTACNDDPVSDRSEEKEIRGYVTEKFTGTSLDSVKVAIQSTDYIAYTDSIGFYEFKDIDYGNYRIIVEKDLYKPADSLLEYYGGGIKTINFELEKNKLTAITDSSYYTLGLVNYKIINNTLSNAYFDHCCEGLIYAVVEEKDGVWYFSDWQNIDCQEPCDDTPIELAPFSTHSDSVTFIKSGTFKIAVLHGFKPEYTHTDTVFTNPFTVLKK